MYEVKVNVDDSGIARAAIEAGKPFVETQAAVRDAGLFVLKTWKEFLSDDEGRSITYSGGTFTIHRRTGTYYGKVTMIWPFQGIGMAAWVGPSSDIKYPGYLETGYESYDMKPGLLASPKAKVSKKGYRYIVIPFWYKGGRARMESEYGDEETAREFGVVHTSSKKHHSQWTHFAVVTENPKVDQSKKWIHPGLKPHPVGQAVQERTQAQVRMMIEIGMAKDVKRLCEEANR